jgi:hypothetical protein
VKLPDLIDFVEGTFTCQTGYPGRYADINNPLTEYATLTHTFDPNLSAFGYSNQDDRAEHELVCKMIASFNVIRSKMPKAFKPKLWWRLEHKADISKNEWHVSRLYTRVYIEGCRDYGLARTEGWGTSHLVRLVVDNAPKVLQLTQQEYEKHTSGDVA